MLLLFPVCRLNLTLESTQQTFFFDYEKGGKNCFSCRLGTMDPGRTTSFQGHVSLT